MLKKFLLCLGGFLAVVLSLGAIKATQIAAMSGLDHSVPPSSVATAEVREMRWNRSIKAIGTLAPVAGVMLSAEADGAVIRIAADNGAAVQAGDLLIEIDASVEEAQLKAAEARAELNRVNLERAKELWGLKAVAKSDYDAAEAAAKQGVADAAALRAVIAKKQVRAPFAGRVGIRQVNLGQFVSRGQAVVPLQQLDPIFANFSVPQRQLPSLAVGQEISVTVDAVDREFVGRITAINAEVDPATRNIFLQATLANPGEQLRAGMFVRVEVRLPEADNVLAVPATAIAYASYGNSVYVVEKMKDDRGREYVGVRQQPVKIGAKLGDLVAISGGIKAGEQVVSAGVFKLRNGAPVQVNNVAQPTSDPAPKPANT